MMLPHHLGRFPRHRLAGSLLLAALLLLGARAHAAESPKERPPWCPRPTSELVSVGSARQRRPSPPRTTSTQPRRVAPPAWTFLVYLNGDNDLDDVVEADLAEMEGAVPAHARLLVLVDRAHAGSQLLRFSAGQREVIEEGQEPDMGDWRTLAAFVERGLALAPARHTALIIWNHGMGWKGPGAAGSRGISADDTSGTHIEVDELGLALRQIAQKAGRRLDLLALDACSMQMAEVAWPIHRLCDVLVASEEVIPRGGFPYDRFLRGLPPEADAESVGHLWVNTYLDAYRGTALPVTLSAWRCRDLAEVFYGIDGLAKALITSTGAPALLKSALRDVQRFTYRDHIDLGHLTDLLLARATDDTVTNALGKLRRALDQGLIAGGSTGGHLRRAQGMAIYFPSQPGLFAPTYNDLDFARTSQWDNLLADYFARQEMTTVLAALEAGDPSLLPALAGRLAAERPDLAADLAGRLRFLAVQHPDLPEASRRGIADLLGLPTR